LRTQDLWKSAAEKLIEAAEQNGSIEVTKYQVQLALITSRLWRPRGVERSMIQERVRAGLAQARSEPVVNKQILMLAKKRLGMRVDINEACLPEPLLLRLQT
jgi:hypothetical protein